jgi:UDP-N-acetyl-D-galactosamine dehydrogenase
MGAYVAHEIMRQLLQRRMYPVGARALILGLAFKENSPDLRNTRVPDVVGELTAHGLSVAIIDPWADPAEAAHENGLVLNSNPEAGACDALVLAVAYRGFLWGASLATASRAAFSMM